MDKIILGTNNFFGFPFPLVLADRFFHIYSIGERIVLDVFRWDEHDKKALYEVRAGQPEDENISTNSTGIITFSEPTTGVFLYKFRPKSGISPHVANRCELSWKYPCKHSNRRRT